MMRRSWWLPGLVVVALVVIVLAPLASSDPDGLERVAEDAGFADAASDAGFEILPDYSVPFLGEGSASLIVAGLIGAALLFGAMWLLGRMLSRRAHSGH
jgi:cobalt/nickel transport system permease protein